LIGQIADYILWMIIGGKCRDNLVNVMTNLANAMTSLANIVANLVNVVGLGSR
jgi:hypothetical protein